MPQTHGIEDFPRSLLASSTPPPALDDAFVNTQFTHSHFDKFESNQFNGPFSQYDDLFLQTANQFDFPDPTSKGSPSSSNEAQGDFEDASQEPWGNMLSYGSADESEGQAGQGPSPGSSASDVNPFSDANLQKQESRDGTSRIEIPVEDNIPASG